MTGEFCSSTHPPLPPTTEDDRKSCLRLLRSRRVGPATYRRLLAQHGSAAKSLAALPDMAREAGVKDYRVCPPAVAEAEWTAGRTAGARLIFEGEADYPSALSEIDDAPPMLWMLGDRALLRRPLIALVGARNASSLGTRMARKLAQELGEAGFTIVSGLARGVDAAAHDAALPLGTIAVMAGGVDVLYPAENAGLAEKIGKQGLRLSDQPMGLQPQARHFVARNRIISGLACATVVIEAAARSGSLITARGALDQGRDVLAVPGHPFDARASGCNMLIRDGATLIRSAQDVIEALGPQADPVAPELPLGPVPHAPGPPVQSATTRLQHADILARIGHTPMAEDQLIRSLGATHNMVSSLLMDLELEGQITRNAGGLIARTV